MTTLFSTADSALIFGLCTIGRGDLLINERGENIKEISGVIEEYPDEIEIIQGRINQFDFEHEGVIIIQTYNKTGHKINIGASKFRDGYDCWIGDPDTGVGVRL